MEVSEKPSEIKIFGHNIYETNIEIIKWQQTKFGLKGGTKKNASTIYLSIVFKQNHYDLLLVLNDKLVFSNAYTYSSRVSLDEIEEMKSKLGKELIKSIKENTGI